MKYRKKKQNKCTAKLPFRQCTRVSYTVKKKNAWNKKSKKAKNKTQEKKHRKQTPANVRTYIQTRMKQKRSKEESNLPRSFRSKENQSERLPSRTVLVDPEIGTARCVLEDLPPSLLLRLLRLHAQRVSQRPDFVLEPLDDLDRHVILLATDAVGSSDHLRNPHCLCVPLVALEATLQVSVALSLEEVVVVALLAEVVHVVVLAVISYLLYHRADRTLVLSDELGVFHLLALEHLGEALFASKRALEFRDAAG